MHSLKLADGTVIDNLKLNGNNYIPKKPIDVNTFKGNLDTISIIDDKGNIEEVGDFRIVFADVGGQQSFIIHHKTKDEIEKEKLQILVIDLDYRLTLKDLGL